jgi:hypothetical protein
MTAPTMARTAGGKGQKGVQRRGSEFRVVQRLDRSPYRFGDLREDGIAVGGEARSAKAASRSQRLG